MIYQPRVMFRPKRKPLIDWVEVARWFAAGLCIGFFGVLIFALVIGVFS